MTGSSNRTILNKLQNIDRRILYILLALVITLPLLLRPGKHPSIIFDEVRNAFSVLDKVPKDKIVLISTMWGPGTEAENSPQTEVLMRHLFMRGTKFVVIAWDPAGSEMTYTVGKKVEKELGKKYGKDWVHLGFRLFYPEVVLRGMAKDFQGVMKYDRSQIPLSKLPAVSWVKGYKQIGATVEITPSGSLESWISYFSGPYKIKQIFCPTAVMAAEAYPYLNSGQVAGMLNGVIGAAQYETLLGMEGKRTDAAATSLALSAALVFVIVLILTGNLAYVFEKRQGRRNQ